jgi:hypothetical protein
MYGLRRPPCFRKRRIGLMRRPMPNTGRSMSDVKRPSHPTRRRMKRTWRLPRDIERQTCEGRRPIMHSKALLLTLEARRVLIFGQRQLGALMGVSRRTVQRWDSGQGGPTPHELARLVVAVHPRDEPLAGKLATVAGTTLEALGLVKPPPPPAAPPPAVAPPPPPPPPPVSPRLVDTVVCAAAEALNVPPPAARPVLMAAFGRALEVGLSVEDVVKALSPSRQAAKPPRRGGL